MVLLIPDGRMRQQAQFHVGYTIRAFVNSQVDLRLLLLQIYITKTDR